MNKLNLKERWPIFYVNANQMLVALETISATVLFVYYPSTRGKKSSGHKKSATHLHMKGTQPLK